jgi:hypothetical protein
MLSAIAPYSLSCIRSDDKMAHCLFVNAMGSLLVSDVIIFKLLPLTGIKQFMIHLIKKGSIAND